ncbi:hypothetical protein K1T71_006214 [Dendrolimus kikuchii]|uniref:Uncharacterized protein n=1 Tax=Dendrolimus kikuchii TaxID=765133 RepID=A0ACC1D3G3_9NEOP|nr:hypothetical protein K1T71_006214 [Dendrolimus kikuchii]
MEWYTTEDGKYRIECLTATTFPGALKVIREGFCQDESVSIGTEVNKNPIATEELLELCADAARDGVSLVALATDTGEVAAVSFNKLQVATSDSSEKPFFEIFAEEHCTQPSSRALIQFMADVDARCNLFEKYGVGCSLEIMFLATLASHRKQKLGTILCKYSIELAKKLKEGPVATFSHADLGPIYASMQDRKAIRQVPEICQAIMTTIATQRIGKNLGFTVHLRLPLTEFSYNGKTYPDRIGFDPHTELVAQRI